MTLVLTPFLEQVLADLAEPCRMVLFDDPDRPYAAALRALLDEGLIAPRSPHSEFLVITDKGRARLRHEGAADAG